MKKIVLIVVVAAVLLAAGVGTALALRGDDEQDARGACGSATYEFTAESEDGGLEVTFELLQSAAPGEAWDVVVQQGGHPLWQGERTTDEDGELDVDVFVDEDRGGEAHRDGHTAWCRGCRALRGRAHPLNHITHHSPTTKEHIMMKRTAALIAAGAIAVPTSAVLMSAPAHADTERHGSIGKGVYEFSVDREGSGYEVNFDIDHVAPGSKWKVVLRHDGKRVLTRTLTADHEGELDIETFRPNTSGKDAFKVKAHRVNGAAKASARITVS